MRRAISLIVLAAAVTAFGSTADAQSRRERVYIATNAPPLTVQRRSFLDSGTVVPVGASHNYVTSQTGPAYNPMEEGFGRSKFGNETLPRRFDTPGRQGPVFGF
jgi:hypothetical protein